MPCRAVRRAHGKNMISAGKHVGQRSVRRGKGVQEMKPNNNNKKNRRMEENENKSVSGRAAGEAV